MLIYNVSQCIIIEIHQMIHIIRWIQCQRRDSQSARKASLSIDLYLLYEITLAETDCFCKDTLMLTRKWSDSLEDTDTPLIKLSSSQEMTRSKMWPCLCVLSWTCCLRLVSAFLWQSQCILKSPKINKSSWILWKVLEFYIGRSLKVMEYETSTFVWTLYNMDA